MSKLIAPHGGRLVNRILSGDARLAAMEKAKSLKKISLNTREIADLEMISNGAFSPLEGFVNSKDYESILHSMHLSNGLPWTIPITLSVSSQDKDKLARSEELALYDMCGKCLGIMKVEELYPADKKRESLQVYKTDDEAHPGVAALYQQGDYYVAGPVSLFDRILHDDLTKYRLDPMETRILFEKKGWKTIVAFQTRNPVHRAHEYIQKTAMEIVDGLLLHPLVGATKSDDIPADVRMECYEVLLKNYFPQNRVVLSVMPANMRYAGPKEAIMHSIIRKNYGVSHFIVGRDHAGVGNYYGTYDAHHIFQEFDPRAITITPLFFDYTFFCKRCGGMASTKTCPHDKDHHVSLSGTKVREMLRDGIVPPVEFTRPEVAEVLIKHSK
ncbi:sulfate adenylyltransferase [bacterium]|nr:sulfate adenylyltransferase [candidate division CSSED10-310 bacterium]